MLVFFCFRLLGVDGHGVVSFVTETPHRSTTPVEAMLICVGGIVSIFSAGAKSSSGERSFLIIQFSLKRMEDRFVPRQ